MGIALIIIIGLFMLWLGWVMYNGHKTLKRVCTAHTTGVVSDINKQTRIVTDEDEDGRSVNRRETFYCPVFEYSVGELKITKVGTGGSGSPKFYIGQQVTIFYNPNKPDEYYVDGDKGGAIAGIILAIMGACFIGAVIYWLFIQ